MLKEYTRMVKTRKISRTRSQMVSAMKHLKAETDKKYWCLYSVLGEEVHVQRSLTGWMGRKGTEPPQNTLIKTKGLERNPREECGCLRRVQTRLSSMVATERDRGNQAKVVTSLGVFCQVALDVSDMKQFVSLFHYGTGKL